MQFPMNLVLQRVFFLKIKGFYKDGKKEGKWYSYDENGVILEITKYKNGVKK